MDIYVVGIAKQANKLIGLRLLYIDGNQTGIKDVQREIAERMIKMNPQFFKNIELKQGKLSGIGGQLDRYGIVGKTRTITILREIVDQSNETVGYICADTTGKIAQVAKSLVPKLAEALPIANGKVVTNQNGTVYIQAIEGSYEKLVRPQQTQQQAKQQTTQPQQHLGWDKLSQLIKALKQFKQYETDSIKSVVVQVEKYKKAQETQEKLLISKYTEWSKQDKAQEQAKDQEQSKAQEPTFDTQLLQLEIQKDGSVYITGYKDDKDLELQVDMILPDTVQFEGASRKIVGIQTGAFRAQKLTGITTGKFMVDIGQHALSLCDRLQYIDISRQAVRFIPTSLCDGDRNLRNIELCSGVERIHEKAFIDCKSLTYIKLPDSCDTVARHAFQGCKGLKRVEHKLRVIQDSAFLNCESLDEFKFDTVTDIGSASFRNTGFSALNISGSVNQIGRKAFADCRKLREVEVCDGAQVLGEYCFAKSEPKEYEKQSKLRHQAKEAVYLENIKIPKQVVEIQVGQFRNVKTVLCYVGQAAEQFCKAYTLNYKLLDYETKDNSQQARIKSKITQQNPVERLLKALSTPVEKAQNPDFEMNSSGELKPRISLSSSDMTQFKFNTPQQEPIEPNIKFKAYVNYISDIQNCSDVPVSKKQRMFYNACNIKTDTLYFDGFNAVYKVTAQVMDDMREGIFIAVLRGFELTHIVDCDIFTDVEIGKGEKEDQSIPVKVYLHAGDKLGQYATISGQPGQGQFDGYGYQRVGQLMLDCLYDYGIQIRMQRKDYYLYVPCADNLVVNIHDECKYEIDPRTGNKRAKGNLQDRYVVVTEIIRYDDFIKRVKAYKKNKNGYADFFKAIEEMPDKQIKDKISQVQTVEFERESQLFNVGKAFKARVDKLLGGEPNDINIVQPNMLTPTMLSELCKQYWMVPKSTQWLKQVGKKQLNKKAEYTIGEIKVIEYISNMVVKFNNPYMNGVKNAYVFEVIKQDQTVGVMASRYSLEKIQRKLYALTRYPSSIEPVELMTDPEHIDEVDARLFYDFYPVLSTKGGWDITKYITRTFGYARVYYVDFYIAMYKPTGVFYLVQYGWRQNQSDEQVQKQQKQSQIVARPLFPIGNMDRALLVAATTNVNQKNFKVLDELMAVQVQATTQTNAIQRYKPQDSQLRAYYNYLKARELAVNGVTEASEYKKLIDDRAVYMIGAVNRATNKNKSDKA